MHVAASSSKADPLMLNIWGSVPGNGPIVQSVDISNGFSGLTIPLASQQLQEEWNNTTGQEYYAPVVNSYAPNPSPYGDLSNLFKGIPFSLNATIYDPSQRIDIEQLCFTRATAGGPIAESYYEGFSSTAIQGAPNYLDPYSVANSLPAWFTGLEIGTGLSSTIEGGDLFYTPSIVVYPGQAPPSLSPQESPVPEPSTYLVFACGALAVGLSRRFRGPA